MATISTAQPFPFIFDPTTTVLIVIDMQRDFIEPDGFGASLGNDVSLLQAIIPTVKSYTDLPDLWRAGRPHAQVS